MNITSTNKKTFKNKSDKWLAFLSTPFIRLIMFIFTCILLLLACIIVFMTDPSKTPITPPCSFNYFTGLYCPGCGMTRAIHAALHFRFFEAFSYNLLWPFMIVIISGSFYIWFYFLVSGKNPFNPFNEFFKKYSFLGWTIVIVIFAFWILRNIPIYPFIMLAP